MTTGLDDGTSIDRASLDHGWTAIPHGYWTLDLTPTAHRVLGWWWSHSPEFLARLSLSETRRQLGVSQATICAAVQELDDAGFITRSDAPGRSTQITVLVDPWKALFGDRGPVQKLNRSSKKPVQKLNTPPVQKLNTKGDHSLGDHSLGDNSSRSDDRDAASTTPPVIEKTPTRDRHFEAACDILDIPWDSPDRSIVGRLIKRVKDQGHPPDEITRRGALHLSTFDFAFTPASFLKRWDQLGSRTTTATPDERRRITANVASSRRLERIQAAYDRIEERNTQ